MVLDLGENNINLSLYAKIADTGTILTGRMYFKSILTKKLLTHEIEALGEQDYIECTIEQTGDYITFQSNIEGLFDGVDLEGYYELFFNYLPEGSPHYVQYSDSFLIKLKNSTYEGLVKKSFDDTQNEYKTFNG